MGSVCDTAEETIDYLTAKGEKVGLVKVRLYRPFSVNLLDLMRSSETIKEMDKRNAAFDRGQMGNGAKDVVEDYMNQVNAKTGKSYHLFDYYGAPDADKVIIAMGSVCDTASVTGRLSLVTSSLIPIVNPFTGADDFRFSYTAII